MDTVAPASSMDLSGLDGAAGIWIDIPPEMLEAVAGTPAGFGGDGRLHVAGIGKPWGYLARCDLPGRAMRPGRIMLRAVLDIRRGGAGLCLVDQSRTKALQQAFVHGRGVHVLELDVTLAEAPHQLVLRNHGPEEAEVEFDLLSLQLALRPPAPPAAGTMQAPARITLTEEQHLPAILAVTPWQGHVEEGFVANWVGSRTAMHFNEHMAPSKAGFFAPTRPPASEEYFEWADMLEAIDAARGGFTMVELGAGYGRWVVDAWNAMRRKGLENLPLRLVAVEAEPQHFRWMQEHFRNNGLDPAQHRLIEAAVAGKPGTVTFSTGHAGAWYGQAIVKTDRIEHADYPEARVIQVPALTLEQVLEGIEAVDLLDMDIQGAELDVCTAGMPTLLRKVRRVHIGTHGDAIDTGLRRLFRAHGWRNLHDYPNGRANRTPFGVIMFGDGVQSWLNPQLA